MENFFYWLGDHWAMIAVIAACVIQITPIKVNPWTALFTWIGKKLNGNVVERLNKIDKSLEEQERIINSNEKDRIRWEVLSFANSCRNGMNHSRDEYQHIIDLSDKYNQMIAKDNDTNGVFSVEYDYIVNEYKRKLIECSFLM